jgi:hypothetical protein
MTGNLSIEALVSGVHSCASRWSVRTFKLRGDRLVEMEYGIAGPDYYSLPSTALG